MKTYALVLIHVLTASVLLGVACSTPVQNKLQGNWVSRDGTTKLKITGKGFAMDKNAEIQEAYFIKGDTIYTSYQGDEPYTKFVIQKLGDNQLTLLDPDSEAIEFTR
jgi:hypothetical protein